MVRILLSFAAALAGCTPSPQETAMHSPSPDPGTTAQGPADAGAPEATARKGDEQARAAQGPIPEPVSVTENPLPGLPADSPAEAQGRRILSTAFVRVGPDGRLTVELRDGRVLALRNVVMRRKDYCGEQAAGGQYCGGYAEVAAARPGAAPSPETPDPTIISPGEPAKGN